MLQDIKTFFVMTERLGANVPRTTSNRHATDQKCKIGTRHYEMLPTGTFSKLVDKNEGLSFLPGDQWRDLTDLPWQYHSGIWVSVCKSGLFSVIRKVISNRTRMAMDNESTTISKG